MNLSANDRAALWDMVESAQAVLEFVRDRTFQDYASHRLLRKGVEREIETIGEAARRLSPEFKTSLPEIPWSKIIAQRNVLIHEYDEIDDSRIWLLLREDIPSLLDRLRPLLPHPPVAEG